MKMCHQMEHMFICVTSIIERGLQIKDSASLKEYHSNQHK